MLRSAPINPQTTARLTSGGRRFGGRRHPEAKSGTVCRVSDIWQIVVEPDEIDGGFVAECLEVPGAMSQGETKEEALKGLVEVLQEVSPPRQKDR
jgi:predicted RNase H-like HicB family nuclease